MVGRGVEWAEVREEVGGAKEGRAFGLRGNVRYPVQRFPKFGPEETAGST